MITAVLRLLSTFAVLFKASITISSYLSSAVFCIALMCGEIPLKVLKTSYLTYFIVLNFVNQLVYFQRLKLIFNEVLI